MYRKHLRMARGEGEAQDSGLKSHFVERVVKLPMVHVAWDYATSTYTHLKESNKLVNFTLTNAEKSVSFVAEQAKPVVRKFEKQIQAVDTLACRGLGTLEEKVPLITKRPEQIIGETRKLYSDAVSSRIEGIRSYSNGKVKSVADYGLQKAVDIFGSHLVQSVVTSVDGALVITEHVLDLILPPVDEEFQNDVNNVDEKEKKSVLARVAHLSSKLRYRAYKHLSQKVKNVQEMALTVQDRALTVVIVPLVMFAQSAKEGVEAAQNYAKALWETLTKEESEEDEHGVLMRLARFGAKELLTVYASLRSILPGQKSEESETESTSQESADLSQVQKTVRHVFMRIGTAFGLLRLLPSVVVLYVFVFVNSVFAKDKDSTHAEVDGIVYEKHEQKQENHVHESGRETQGQQ